MNDEDGSVLVIYSAMESGELAYYCGEIEEAHPDIRIRLERMSTSALRNQILREGREGQWDIIFGWSLSMLLHPDVLELLDPLDAVDLAGLPAFARDDRRRWFSPSAFVPAFCVDRQRLEDRGIPFPSTWRDLGNAAFARELVIPDPSYSGAGFLHLMALLQCSGDAYAYEVLHRVARNMPVIVRSALAPCHSVMNGSAAVGISVSTAVQGLVNDGHLVELVVPADAPAVEPEGFAMRSGSAKRGMAQRALSWTLGQPARSAYERYGKVALVVPTERETSGVQRYQSIDAALASKSRNIECARWDHVFHPTIDGTSCMRGVLQ